MPLIWASLTTSHRCRGACQEKMERKEGWLGGDQGGEEKRGEGGGFPSLLPLFFAELSRALSKELLKSS